MRVEWEYKRLMSTGMALAIFLLAAALGAALPVESQVVEESASLSAASLMADARNMASELGFGKAMMKHFSIDKEYINLNHGVIASGTIFSGPLTHFVGEIYTRLIPVILVLPLHLCTGSYGSTPKHVQRATAAWRAQMERNPDVLARSGQTNPIV
jgi:hypothetical protein